MLQAGRIRSVLGRYFKPAGSSGDPIIQKKIRNARLYKRSLGDPEAARPLYPVEIFLEISNACNLRCLMCASFSKLKTGKNMEAGDPGIMDREVIQRLRPAMEYAILLHPYGFGEPLMVPYFVWLVQQAKDARMLVDFFTTATLLNPSKARDLVEAGADVINVSFHGASKDSYELIHHGARFEHVMDNLRSLKEEKIRQGSPHPKIIFQSLAMQENFHEIPDIVRTAGEIGAEQLELKPMVTYETIPDLISWRRNYDPETDDAILNKARSIAAEYGLHFNDSLYKASRVPRVTPVTRGADFNAASTRQSVVPLNGNTNDVWPTNSRPTVVNAELPVLSRQLSVPTGQPSFCFQPFKTMYVKQDGRVKTCCFGHRPILGDLKAQNVEQVWQGEDYQRMRHLVQTQGQYPVGCNHCLSFNLRPQIDDIDDLLRRLTMRYPG